MLTASQKVWQKPCQHSTCEALCWVAPRKQGRWRRLHQPQFEETSVKISRSVARTGDRPVVLADFAPQIGHNEPHYADAPGEWPGSSALFLSLLGGSFCRTARLGATISVTSPSLLMLITVRPRSSMLCSARAASSAPTSRWLTG